MPDSRPTFDDDLHGLHINSSYLHIKPKPESSFGIERTPDLDLISSVQDEPVVIEVANPAKDEWYCGAGFIAPEQTLNVSQGELSGYHGRFLESQAGTRSMTHYPWRTKSACTTHLPLTLRGWLTKDVPEVSSITNNQAHDILTDSLSNDSSMFKTLLGESGWHVLFKQNPNICRLAYKGGRDIDSTPASRLVLCYQQVYQDSQDNEWPVFGGKLTFNLTDGDKRLFVTNSYWPVAKFNPKPNYELEFEQIARKALAHYWEKSQNEERPLEALKKWNVERRLYADQTYFILPFAGNYYLVTQVILRAPDDAEIWRVFVDVEHGKVIDRPESMLFHLLIPAHSGEASHDPEFYTEEFDEDSNPIAHFMDIRVHDPDESEGRLVNWGDASDFDAHNVAFHANKMYQYFITELGFVEPLQAQPNKNLSCFVGMPFNDGRLNALDFSAITKRVRFQQDDGTGLETGNRRVFHPAHDPEVIYHEIAHALMWCLNPDPFEHVGAGVAPFARSLIEGYATYYACSLGQQERDTGDGEMFHWAEAAYRTGSQPDEWGARWAFGRTNQVIGEDRLLPPNLYPWATASGLQLYDAGMIWARALWDIRSILPPIEADRLALEAYIAMRGSMITFEAAAEALIDAATRDLTWQDSVPDIINIFVARGILAEKGVQALSVQGNDLLIGTDLGLWQGSFMSRLGRGLRNVISTLLSTIGQLRNIVSLTTHGSDLYAVIEVSHITGTDGPKGVYKKNGNRWEAVGRWPVVQRLTSLAVGANGTLYAATGTGVWHLENVDGTWDLYNPSSKSKRALSGVTLDIAYMPENQTIVAAGIDHLWSRKGKRSGWKKVGWPNGSQPGMVTSVTIHQNSVYFGTTHGGLWQLLLKRNGSLQTIAHSSLKANQINHAAIVSLVSGGQQYLYLGTSQGVYRFNPNDSTENRWLSDSSAFNKVVFSLAATESHLFAGTALDGLWRYTFSTNQWEGIPFQ